MTNGNCECAPYVHAHTTCILVRTRTYPMSIIQQKIFTCLLKMGFLLNLSANQSCGFVSQIVCATPNKLPQCMLSIERGKTASNIRNTQ